MPKEIEIKVRIERSQPLLELLKRQGTFLYAKRQVDEYFTPPDRDFTAVRPVKEWLRLRDAEGSYSLNYKNWFYEDDGQPSTHCDEYETEIQDIAQARNVLIALKHRPLATVDKQRTAWQYKEWEIAIDAVKGIGDCVEIEYKGDSDHADPKRVSAEMYAFLQTLNCGKIERNSGGYPFILMFPDEAKWEGV